MATVPKALAIMNLLHHAFVGPFLPPALLLYSNLVPQPRLPPVFQTESLLRCAYAVFCPPSCSMSHSGFSQAECLPLLGLKEGPASLPRAYPLHHPNTRTVSVTPASLLCLWKDLP